MNREEALRCLQLSRQYAAKGNHEKALKFATKSLSLSETPEGRDWLSALHANDWQGQETNDPKNRERPARSRSRSCAPSPDPGKPSRTSSSAATAENRDYTNEQVEAVQKIKRCGDDLYAILDVSRDATEAELKKAYRKMALHFHPDKNAAPGAADAFKAIGNAFAILSHADKRAIYDRMGIRGLKQGLASSSSSSTSTDFQGHSDPFFAGDISPEELFNLFFGGGSSAEFGVHGPFQSSSATFTLGPDGQPMFRSTRGGPRFARRPPREPRRPDGAFIWRWGSLVQFFPILIFFLFSLLSNWSPSKPTFSWAPVGKHTERRFTSRYRVAYYVQPSEYVSYFDSNDRMMQAFDQEVEAYFINHLQTQCSQEMEVRQRRINHARWWGTAAQMEDAMQSPTPSCARLKEMR